MTGEVKVIKEPQELMQWMSEHDVLMDVSAEEIQLLLNYLEGHDYAMGTDKEEKLIRVDIADEEYECTEYSMDDFIDLVCEWNYELLLDADMRKNNPKDFRDFLKGQEEYENLKQDEIILDKMFEQTKYGKHICQVAEKIAGQVIEMLGKDMDDIVAVVADGVKEYKAERVR